MRDTITIRGLVRAARPSGKSSLIVPSRPIPQTRNLLYHRQSARNRYFSATVTRNQNQESFTSRLREALGKTKIVWKPIPVGLGIGFLGLLQFYKVHQREKASAEEEERRSAASGYGDKDERPRKRKKIRPSGPW